MRYFKGIVVMAALSVASASFGQYNGPLVTQSPLWASLFVSTDGVPHPYSFQGVGRIDTAQLGGGKFRVYSIDQLAWVNDAKLFGNPCNMQISISCDILENGNRLVRTVYPQRWGSYWLSSRNIYGGGVNSDRFDVMRPTFRFKVVAAAFSGYGAASRTWLFTP